MWTALGVVTATMSSSPTTLQALAMSSGVALARIARLWTVRTKCETTASKCFISPCKDEVRDDREKVRRVS
jgi:hypothetical protein